ncbi:MAG: bifunctional shikimate kinase/3-dehydroquinate synthase [Kofleriaceae bacterium]
MPAPLCLVGLPAAGKTTVGRHLAAALGRRFVDLDAAIADAVGEPAAALVARDEPRFRRVEAAALAEALAATDGPVIATGGGAAAHGDNVERMRAAGLVVELAVSLAELRRRAVDGPARPLLDDDRAAFAERARARAPWYRRAHAVVATDGRRLDEVVAAVAEVHAVWAALPSARARDGYVMGLPGRAHPVLVADAAPPADELAAHLDGRTPALMIDGNVAAAWPDLPTTLGLAAAPRVIVPPGEASKSFAGFGVACEQLVAAGVDRGGVIVAVGGGVTGDLAGLVAATLLRGLPVVHLPTTVVAMTDSAIGGKTAIDLPAGKNLVGAFWQPRLVWASLEVLASLPPAERQAGFGELWKYALLDGEATWAAVEAVAGWATAPAGAPPPPAFAEVVRRAVAQKGGVVVRDERETGDDRILLNLGHTVGHAMEAEAGLAHGVAVALGLVAACQVAAALGHAPAELTQRVVDALATTGLPHDPRPYLTPGALARLGADKKRRGTHVRFVMPFAVGRCAPVELAVDDLATILRATAAP